MVCVCPATLLLRAVLNAAPLRYAPSVINLALTLLLKVTLASAALILKTVLNAPQTLSARNAFPTTSIAKMAYALFAVVS